MNKKLEELASYIEYRDRSNKSISQATIGWQMHHSLSVINGVCLSLMRSREEDYQASFNFKKILVFLIKKFPRGKVKAPKKLSLPVNPNEEDIRKQLKNAQKLLNKIEELPTKSHFKHAIFGILNLKESKKFLQIHTEHHLKIIRDILK